MSQLTAWSAQRGPSAAAAASASAMSEEATAALVAKFKTMAEAHGTVKEVDEWGKRRLAYPIEDLNEGYYVLMTFESKPELPAELDRVMKITDGIMRCLITTVEA